MDESGKPETLRLFRFVLTVKPEGTRFRWPL